MIERRCENCDYYNDEAIRLPPDTTGICHRYPPDPSPYYTAVHGQIDWCGEFKPKEEAKPE